MALDLVFVAKGSFIMGDTWGDGYDCEKPTHKVTFTYNFLMHKYETERLEYLGFCEATGRDKPLEKYRRLSNKYDVVLPVENYELFREVDYGGVFDFYFGPVTAVSWWDAIAYCNWLSEKEQIPKAYDSDGNFLDKDGRTTTDPSKVVGYRLPTEAEWEYAARGGNKSNGYKYSGSNNPHDVAWFRISESERWRRDHTLDPMSALFLYRPQKDIAKRSVGRKSPNELGLYDMSGNVWEWCSDWYDYGYYAKSPTTNPYNKSTDAYWRVLRGGSWDSYATYVRVAYRDYYIPSGALDDLGFRICRTVY